MEENKIEIDRDLCNGCGYCVTLAEPYQTFRSMCSECNLGKALMEKYGKGNHHSEGEERT